MSEWLKVEEVAEHFRVTPGTIRAWARRYSLPVLRVNPRLVRYRLKDIEAALRARGGE